MLSLLDRSYDIQTNTKEVAPNLHQVKSKPKEDVAYAVDMTIVQNDRAITNPRASSLKSAKNSVITEKRVTTSNLNRILVYSF